MRKMAMSTPGVRDMAWRFVAGENLEIGLATLRTLNARGIKATMNYVGTHIQTVDEAVGAADAAIECLHRIHQEDLDANVSVKLTHLGIDIDEAICRSQLVRVLDSAYSTGGFVRIDMEESVYAERTIQLFEEMRLIYGDAVGIVLQSYLHRTRNDLERLLESDALIRLVKGGYWESSKLVYRKTADIDVAFICDLEQLLRRGRHPAIATHDRHAVDEARRIAMKLGLRKENFEFQMLYGVCEDLQSALVNEGYKVRSYVPYGPRWYEYFLGCVRRAPGMIIRKPFGLSSRRRSV